MYLYTRVCPQYIYVYICMYIYTLHSKLITPPLGSGGGMAAICHTAARGGWAFECPFVRLGVGLARLCHATSRGGWGFWMELMVWGWGWENLSGWGWGGCLRKGEGGGALAPRPNCHNLHLKCPSPIPIPTPPIPNVPQCPFPIQIPTNIAGGLIFSNTSGSIFSMGAPRLYQHILGL